ncbi:hypothetical protein NC653_040850 [Populus alba x Populus x berolinensis]|uniref:Uncharacterized protein n=1 Tax=Populus alba x Populus x berolinensis TaxID=444605 RepID=A0AAD6L740_9ROSI|nr:hypothetical protein NC653_040850 [Populus alba x Populus x berolinensis]
MRVSQTKEIMMKIWVISGHFLCFADDNTESKNIFTSSMISFPPAFHNQAFILRKKKKWDAARGISRTSSDFQRKLHFD